MTKTANIYFPTSEFEKIFINSIWRLSEYDVNRRIERILPKGTVEIIFNFSEKIEYVNASLQVSKVLPSVFVNGINFRPFELIKSGPQDFLGIQLNSLGLRLLFNLSVKEFNNGVYEGALICVQLDELADELYCNQVFCKQTEIIMSWINKRNSAVKYYYSLNRLQKLQSLIFNDNKSVKKISEEICLSDR